MHRTAARVLVSMVLLSCTASLSAGQTPPRTTPQPAGSPPTPGGEGPTLDDNLEAGDDEGGRPVRQIVDWNHFELKFFTLEFGAGFLYDYAAYAQDADSKSQIEMHPDAKVRDSRVLFRGRIKVERPTTWSVGILYDTATKQFRFRQTQVMIEVPEIWGNLVIGRTKEGFSLNKVMIGYGGWTMERATISDATLPILADGVKWIGYIPEKKILWNVGHYWDVVSEGEGFSTYDRQISGRFAYLPIMSEETKTLLHLGLSLRQGKVNNGFLQNRSRPEAFPAPFFIDTGSFPAKSTIMAAPEIYYRPGPLLIGSEYFFQDVNAPERGNPFFHGGDVFISWIATGETRVYNTKGGFFDQISPARTVYSGGPGAWEFVGRFSYSDLDSKQIRGGKFWRFTPMVNWHMSDNIRLEFAYGIGSLDRFNTTGQTQFFQTRIQLQF